MKSSYKRSPGREKQSALGRVDVGWPCFESVLSWHLYFCKRECATCETTARICSVRTQTNLFFQVTVSLEGWSGKDDTKAERNGRICIQFRHKASQRRRFNSMCMVAFAFVQ